MTFWLEIPKRVSIFFFFGEKKEYQLSYKGIVLGNAI